MFSQCQTTKTDLLAACCACAGLLACCATQIAACWPLLLCLIACLIASLANCFGCLPKCPASQAASGRRPAALLLAAFSLQSLGRSLLGCARAASLQLLACRRAAPACFSGARCSCSAGGCVAWARAWLLACTAVCNGKTPSFLNPKPN
jgi:hypothetical protein